MRAYMLSLAVRTRHGKMQSVTYLDVSTEEAVDWTLVKRHQLTADFPGCVIVYYKVKDITAWVTDAASALERHK